MIVMNKVSMKVYAIALAGLFMMSCGKSSGNDSDSISDDGLFGSEGSEFIDIFYNEPDEIKMRDKVEFAIRDEMEAKYPGFKTYGYVQDRHLDEYDQKVNEAWSKVDLAVLKDKWDNRLPNLIEELKTKNAPTNVIEGVPLKIVKPFKIDNVHVDNHGVSLSCTVELTSTGGMMADYPPEFLFVDVDDEVVLRCRAFVDESKMKARMEPGTQLLLYLYISDEDAVKNIFSSKCVKINWRMFKASDGKMGPIKVGASYTDLPKSVECLYDKFDHETVNVEDEMEGDYTSEYCKFYKGDKEVFRVELEDGIIRAIILHEGSSGIVTNLGFYVGIPARKLVRIDHFVKWNTYYDGEVFGEHGRNTYYVSSDEVLKEIPTGEFDFKPTAKVTKIVCR